MSHEQTIRQLRAYLNDRLVTDETVRAEHGKDESCHAPRCPDAVAFPESTEEVSQIVRICGYHQTPIIPFGRGSAVEGGVLAVQGGISVDLSRMNRILRLSVDDMDVTVEAGVTRKQLAHHLQGTHLFFSVDPGADATLGGMASTRASGTNAFRYGTMRENVLSLEVVLPEGRVIRTARRARKSSAGYDLTHLFVGAEGTLGIITGLTLRLHREPQAISAAVCPFPTIENAVRAAMATIQSGIPVARLELLDEVAMDAVSRYASLEYAATPTLFFEFHGTNAAVREQAELVESLALQHHGEGFRWAVDPEQRARLWQARHDAYYAALALRPGCRALPTDVCVPISRLAECIMATKEDLRFFPFPAPLVGHVGDGNFHLIVLIHPDRLDEMELAHHLNDRLVQRALDMEGTCTGEHGIGCGKMDFLISEHGEAVNLMRLLKRAVDPDNILNPGKVVIV